MLASFFTQADTIIRVPGTNHTIPGKTNLKDTSFGGLLLVVLILLIALLTVLPLTVIKTLLKLAVVVPSWAFLRLRKALAGV